MDEAEITCSDTDSLRALRQNVGFSIDRLDTRDTWVFRDPYASDSIPGDLHHSFNNARYSTLEKGTNP